MKFNTLERLKERITVLEYAGVDAGGVPYFEETVTLPAKIRPANKLGHVSVHLDEWYDPERAVFTRLLDHRGNLMFPVGNPDQIGGIEYGQQFKIFGVYPRVTAYGDINRWMYILQGGS